MAEVRWSDRALNDLESIVLYISKDSKHFAELFSHKIFKIADNLAKFPNLGRVVPEVGRSELREIIFGNYRIVYRTDIERNQIEIIAVHHGAMLLKNTELLGD